MRSLFPCWRRLAGRRLFCRGIGPQWTHLRYEEISDYQSSVCWKGLLRFAKIRWPNRNQAVGIEHSKTKEFLSKHFVFDCSWKRLEYYFVAESLFAHTRCLEVVSALRCPWVRYFEVSVSSILWGVDYYGDFTQNLRTSRGPVCTPRGSPQQCPTKEGQAGQTQAGAPENRTGGM